MNTTSIEVGELREATDVAVDRLVNHGQAMTTMSLNNLGVLARMKNEVVGLTPTYRSLFRKHGVEDGWEGVERATFFGKSHLRHAKFKQIIGAIVLPSRLWLPNVHSVAMETAEVLRASSSCLEQTDSDSLASLKKWRPNRIGINRMEGTENRPAIIAEHTDVATEVGAVVVFDLYRSGMKKDERVIKDNMTIIFSSDVCAEVGVDQPPHGGVEPVNFRLSVTFAELNPSIAI